jgi:hypothetical protein
VSLRSVVDGKGRMRVMFFLSGWLMKRSSCDAATKELDSLKAFCEGREAGR